MKVKVVNLKLPADLVNHAKGLAGWRGKTLKQFVTEAIEEKVERATQHTHAEVEERIRGKGDAKPRGM